MWSKYPYINYNDLNLDFILKAIKEMEHKVNDFVSLNAIKYANPIQWNITKQYEKNTVVIEPVSGTAYISVKPVPAGVNIVRTEYWSVVFDLGRFVTKGVQNLANRIETITTLTATFDTPKDIWLVWNETLYYALDYINAGDAYVPNSNIKRITIEDVYWQILSAIDDEIQARTDADTALGGRIDDEIQARTDADTALGGRIDDEIQARTDADTALGGRIDDEIQARTDADTALGGRIDDCLQSSKDYTDSKVRDIQEFGNTIVLGNSYASGTGDPDHHGIFYWLQSIFAESYLFSGSGTSFIDYDGNHSGDTFLTHLEDAIASPLFANSTIDSILIVGAYGESRAYIQSGRSMISTRSNLNGAVTSFATRARQAFPNLKQIVYVNAESRAKNRIVSGGYTSFISDTYNVGFVTYPLFSQNGIINMGWAGLAALYKADNFSSDLYHPNGQGYRMIASTIIDKIRGGVNATTYKVYYSWDVSSLVGINGASMHGNHLISDFRNDFACDYITLPAGNYSISPTYIDINVNDSLIPPPNLNIGDLHCTPTSLQGQSFNWIFKLEIINDDMFLRIHSDRSVTGTASYDLPIPFVFGLV